MNAYTTGTFGSDHTTFIVNVEGELSFDKICKLLNFKVVDLKTLDVGENVTSIDEKGFIDCSELVSIKVSQNVKTIKENAFCNCVKLTHIIIFSKNIIVCNNAFANCLEIEFLMIPKLWITIDNNAFSNNIFTSEIFCSGIFELNDISYKFVVNIKGDLSLDIISKHYDKINFNNIKELYIGTNVTEIIDSAFSGCCNLECNLNIPDSVKKIGGRAFYCCGLLSHLSISNNVEVINEHAFYNCYNLRSIIIPDKVKKICEYAFMNCVNVNSLKLSENLEIIERHVFQNCLNLPNHLTIPYSVNKIESHAFIFCKNLSNVHINKKTKINERTFKKNKIIFTYYDEKKIDDDEDEVPPKKFHNILSLNGVKYFNISSKLKKDNVTINFNVNLSCHKYDHKKYTIDKSRNIIPKKIMLNDITCRLSYFEYASHSDISSSDEDSPYRQIIVLNDVQYVNYTCTSFKTSTKITFDETFDKVKGTFVPKKVMYDGIEYLLK